MRKTPRKTFKFAHLVSALFINSENSVIFVRKNGRLQRWIKRGNLPATFFFTLSVSQNRYCFKHYRLQKHFHSVFIHKNINQTLCVSINICFRFSSLCTLFAFLFCSRCSHQSGNGGELAGEK